MILAPPGAALAQVKAFAFVPNHLDDNVTVIDTTGPTVIGSAVPTGSSPFSATVSPDGRLVYVTNTNDNAVTVIDVVTRHVIGSRIPVGNGPWGTTFTKDGRTAYVSNQSGSTVSVVDVATGAVSGPPIVLPVNSFPRKLVITPDGLGAYVTSNAGVFPVDLASGTVGTVIPIGGFGGGLAIAPGGQIAFSSVIDTNEVLLIDLDSNTVLPTPIAVGVNPFTVVISPDEQFAYVANPGSNTVSVIDVANDGTLTKIGAGTLTLLGTNTHAGTTVAAGTILVDGTHTSAPLYVAGGTLGGSGSVGDVTMSSGVLAPGGVIPGAPIPGAATAILFAAQVTLAADVQFIVELNGTVAGPGDGYDRLDVSGVAAINGASLKVVPSILPATGTTFTILTNATGTFAGLAEGDVLTADGRHYRISYAGGDGNDVTLTVVNDVPTISAIPSQSVTENTPLDAVAFTVGDSDGDVAALVVIATSSNQAVVADANITLGGSGASRTIAIAPNIAARGETAITAGPCSCGIASPHSLTGLLKLSI